MPIGLLYLLFFLSGAAALVYQVVWVRSLTLVFGGSHLAVTAVLTIFMCGLALGGYVVGRRVDRNDRPLRLYGLLEFGIAASALVFVGLMTWYPSIYVVLAQGRDEATLYLTAVRMGFSIVALIVPTVLMGGTLPVLARIVAARPEQLRRHLALLYAVNTLGAVLGALLAGFVFLRFYSVSATLYLAIATNVLIGLASVRLQQRLDRSSGRDEATEAPAIAGDRGEQAAGQEPESQEGLPVRWVLWGIGLSGFCALGYEVLWTRVLTMAVGASVYSFTVILAAFLTGIALGSQAYGMLVRAFRHARPGLRRVIAWFGLVQLAIGVSALVVTVYLRDIPVNAVRLQTYVLDSGLAPFQVRAWANFLTAFFYMVVPALFMGAAFPMAGEVLARHGKATGQAVGDVLAANTVGAILGAAVSGLVLMNLFGIERSLQMLAILNAGAGLFILAGLRRSHWLPSAAAVSTLAVMAVLVLNPDVARLWDRQYFAIFRSNQPEAFRTPEMIQEAVENTDVLYFAEGNEAIVSVIQIKGGELAFLTNGRVEASSHVQAQQIQYTLGHLPMLLNRDPKDALVVGMGSGMTAGATAVHPGVEQVTLVEIEPKVLGVARAFERYNHHVLDNPKVTVIFNDGRNFLMTTNRMFDVITADPIHPWFKGAGSLYASEYFALAAKHLRPGGVIAQWLPIYELTPADLASVVKTFQQHFAHTMMWLTHYDAALLGSNDPFVIDERTLARRISDPAIAGDLQAVSMGSATDLLSYFVMGTEGMTRFGQNGVVNTDDHPYLEFSAPFSIGTKTVMSENVQAIAAQRETILPYLTPETAPEARIAQLDRWNIRLAAGHMADRALALYLGGGPTAPDFTQALRRLTLEYPAYAPGRALWTEYQTALSLEPRLLEKATLQLVNEEGRMVAMEVSAVLVPVSGTRAAIMFVDNRARTVFGQRYLDDYARDGRAEAFAADVMTAIRAAHEKSPTLRTVKAVIDSEVRDEP